MYQYEYYTTKKGEQPVRGWIAALPLQERAVVRQKIEKLSEEGLKLLQTNMLTTIEGHGGDFYELRTGQLRIGLYFVRHKDTFVLLHGWRKKKQKQPKDIEEAYSRLQDYLSLVRNRT